MLSFTPTVSNAVGNIASTLISKINFGHLAKSFGGFALGSLASYGVNKAIEKFSNPNKAVVNAVHDPKLTIDAAPQGLLRGDILPVKNTIERIDPSNHTISLPDGYVKNLNTISKSDNYTSIDNTIPKKRNLYGGKITKKKKGKGNFDMMYSSQRNKEWEHDPRDYVDHEDGIDLKFGRRTNEMTVSKIGKRKQSGGNLHKILNNKSKDILKGILHEKY